MARCRSGGGRVSRDGVIRDLLEEHVALQEQRAPVDRPRWCDIDRGSGRSVRRCGRPRRHDAHEEPGGQAWQERVRMADM